jgi:predicted O-linked N-acetylglucosamine transferase (SPINDLY family)
MNESQMFEQAKVYLEQGNYEQAVELLEQCIEGNEEDINYYWYLGLAYLLQEQEENAQMTWLLVMSQGDESEVVQWTQALLNILETEAQRQEQIENIKLSWLIRSHIREIKPSLINNLLYLIDLEIKLQYYNPQHLEDWQVINYLTNNVSEKVDSTLLLKIIPNILDSPVLINIDFLQISLKYITEIQTLILILKSTADKMAYENLKPNYAVDLTKISLQLKPSDLELINNLYDFSLITQNYSQMRKSAEDYVNLADLPDCKAFGYYRLIQTLITGGEWFKAKKILPSYITSLKKLIELNSKIIDPTIKSCVSRLAGSLMYLEDNPSLHRQLQNSLCSLFQNYSSNLIIDEDKKSFFDADNSRSLKIGYIAHTFRRHSVGFLSRWLIHHHNREKFIIYLYLIDQPDDDITQKWFRKTSDFVYNLPPDIEKITSQIKQDKIDILVDLDSISYGTTSQVMAMKNAPVQTTWLGMDASGLPSIDYFIVDPYVLPDNAQDYYRETLWRLPQTYLAIDGFEVAVPTLRRKDLDISKDEIIYLTLQSSAKLHPDTIHLQMKILKDVPNSCLLVKTRDQQKGIQNLFTTIAEEHKINLDRLHFLENSDSEEIHRANLSIADVVLDFYPYNGATTTLETLWMEIPLVTRVGQQFASRNSYTFMINAGVTEGIAWTDEEYVNWGVRLGKDERLRQKIHWKLKQSKNTAPIWNAKKFTRDMENAYQQMWMKYLNFS